MAQPSNNHAPNPIPQDTQIELRRIGNNRAIINLNGEEYEVTFFQGQRNITSERDWSAIAKGIGTLFQNASVENFETAKIRLSGDLSDLQAADLHDKPVKIISAEATYHDEITNETKVKEWTGAAVQNVNAVALKNLKDLGNRLKSTGTVANSPAQPASASTPPQYHDERITTCVGRAHDQVTVSNTSHPDAYHALADQLSKIPKGGHSNFENQPINTIITSLKTEVPQAIKAKIAGPTKQQWISENIKDITDSLNQARISDDPDLGNAVSQYNANRTAQNLSTVTAASIEELLVNKTPSTFTADESEFLVNLYIEYTSRESCKFVGTTFFKTFVEIHQQQDKQDHFQVVLIQEKNGVEIATSIPVQGNISTSRCAFIHIDANGNYSSYNRAASGNLPDLNEGNKTISAVPKRIQGAAPIVPISAPVINTQRIDAAGRCLDMSIAYQILRKKYSSLSHEDITNSAELATLANELRRKSAELIRTETDDLFFIEVQHSIGNIPAFALGNDATYSNEQKATSTTSVKRQLGVNPDGPFNDIKVWARADVGTLSADQKRTLREFYANYIEHQPEPAPTTEKGKYYNYLDSAFLRILPKVALDGSSPPIKCAIVQDGKIFDKIESRDSLTELNSNEWIFVKYTAKNHYDAVDTLHADTSARLSAIITADKDKELNDFLALIPNSNAEVIKKRLNEEIKFRHPKAYTALARIMWKVDHDNWTRSDKSLAEPGKPVEQSAVHGRATVRSPQSGIDLDPEGYGGWRLANIAADELKNAMSLLQFAKAQITQAMQTIPAV